MKTIVSIPHHEYPQKVRDRVEEKLQTLVKFYERIVSMRAVLERDHDDHRVEIVANVGHGTTLVVDSKGEVLEKALDDALHKMGRVLNRHKTKMVDRARKGGRVGH